MEKLVEEFRKFVSATWKEQLNENTCIPIHIRKLVRDLLREYIRRAPPLKNEHKKIKRPINLFMKEYVEQNPVYIELFKNNVWMHDSAVAIKDFPDMYTLGRLLLMAVYRIMTGATDTGTIMDSRDPNDETDVDRQMDYFCYLFLWYMGSIALQYKNKSLIIGIPMYWWRGEELVKLVHLKLDQHFNEYDPDKFSNGAVSFARYMSNTYDKVGDDSSSIPHINISFSGFSTNFISSVPEIILDGLCYTVYDKITKYGTTFYLDVFMNPTRYNGFTYKTLDHSKQGVVDGITKDDVGNRGAIRFKFHPSFSRRVSYRPTGGVTAIRHPNYKEDTYVKQHNVDNNQTPTIFTRNYDNNGYYLDYHHYSHTEDSINNEFERRDKLTYDNVVCLKHRFDGDIDNDKTSYHRILRDRFVGLLSTKPPLSEVEVIGDDEDNNDNPLCMDIDKLDKLISPLENYVKDKPCCSKITVGLGSSTNTTSSNYPIVRETYRPTWTRTPHTSIFNRHYPYNTYNLDAWWRRQRHGAIW
ncbi:A-type inclusion protein [Pseudocowpox virus]|uniref:A-type inclusion protein n=1 Tax=Pseudocowpox virus TaxID=129726 RepID=D3IZQ1_9POXV|nr:A-type inclusion protein [Pseudocowpox virus]ADC54005.1 A-type inclusion protein [Pseudocowpox virus]